MQDFFFVGIISAIALAFVVIKGILFTIHYYNLDKYNEIIRNNESLRKAQMSQLQTKQTSIEVVNNWRMEDPRLMNQFLVKTKTRRTPTSAYSGERGSPRVPLASSDLEVLDLYSNVPPPTPSYIYDERIGGTIV
ncbi:hypothetical protein GZH46_01752 [Fragariocoptes setiger]|uniref:Uncharacterized protein n=1 Tax=Fragariocoptes setiger TaxID=1670756 RepID=A0ABQ7S8G9_9ACAR|nr:hypothetical protein GZH46_01752 [Fragariocoptes setiger]